MARAEGGYRVPKLSVPTVSPWPSGLPPVTETCIPPDVERALNIRLLECEQLPSLFRDMLAENNRLWHIAADIAVAEKEAEIAEQSAQALAELSEMYDNRVVWEPWQAWLIVGGVAVGGLVVGFLTGFVYTELQKDTIHVVK